MILHSYVVIASLVDITTFQMYVHISYQWSQLHSHSCRTVLFLKLWFPLFFPWWLYSCTTFSFPHIFIFPFCCTWPCLHFQHDPCLMSFPYLRYLCDSTPWLRHENSLIGILAKLSWINPQACVLCCSMLLTIHYAQPGASQKIPYINLPLSSRCTISSYSSPFLYQFGYLGIKCSFWCHILGIP